MHYYKVLPTSQRFHGQEALTYSYTQKLAAGNLVRIELKNQPVTGIVVAADQKPKFKTKSIETVLDIKPLPKAALQLLDWLIQYYPAPLGVTMNQFIPSGLEVSTNKNAEPGDTIKTKALPPLTKEQSAVLKDIKRSNSNSFLLHGDTGTGKTRVYIELAKQQLKNGRSVLILTPEIGLTPQLVREFEQSLGVSAVVMHSSLTPAQRRQAWLSVLVASKPVVVVGPRSALFAPFSSLGLIVVDEAHDSAYKQEQAPYYQAIRVAGQLAVIHKAVLIIGSATPNITDYHIAQAKQIPVLRMKQLAVKSEFVEPSVDVIDSRNKALFSKSGQLSDSLLKSIETGLKNDEQALIFLNRRGSARLVLCQNCGWQALCSNCDLPLTYHSDHHLMRCHTCGYSNAAPTKCPVCQSLDIIYRSAGTKAIVESLQKSFPKARIQRFDSDNKKHERFEQHHERIGKGDVDILVGTQILTKGLDLPKLSLVGVIAADSSLSFPDYTAEERTYQQLSQIIGRVGRGHRPGTAIIQTYQPDSSLIKSVISKDWASFYKTQLEQRRKYMFPPFCYLLKLTCTRKTIKSAQTAAASLAGDLKSSGLKIQVIGPTPSFYEKSSKGYTWQLVIKTKDRSQLIELVKALPSGWSYDLDPANLL